VPGYATFYSDKQIFTQPAEIASLEHRSITMRTLVSKQNASTTCNFISSFA